MVGSILLPVFQAPDGVGTELDLVEEDQRPPGHDPGSAEGLEVGQHVLPAEFAAEQGLRRGVLVEVHVGDRIEPRPSELLQQPGLPDLAGAAQNERLAVRLLEPVVKTFQEKALHFNSFATGMAPILTNRLAKINMKFASVLDIFCMNF